MVKSVACNVDEFIESARNYARGMDNIVRLRPVEPEPQVEKSQFRKAIFSLNEESIEALTKLAEETGMNKSHLLRMMIKQMDKSHSLERQLMICRYK